MKIVIQRVKQASVNIAGKTHSHINQGLLILVGITHEDSEEDVKWLAQKTADLRIFDDEDGIMNKSVIDIDGEILVVSQFTLMASYRKGNRPSWMRAARHEHAIPLYETYCKLLSEKMGKTVKQGVFGAEMLVAIDNDGPVTICMDTQHKE